MMWYQESDDRIRVLSPVILYERPLSSTLTLKVDGIYNAISGATPTGAPPVRVDLPAQSGFVATGGIVEDILAGASQFIRSLQAPAEPTDEPAAPRETRTAVSASTPESTRTLESAPEREAASNQSSSSSSSSGATESSTNSVASPPGTRSRLIIPSVEIDDERVGFNIGLDRKVGKNSVGGQVSYSTEKDYESISAALHTERLLDNDVTSLHLGSAFNHDRVEVFTQNTTESKDTVDLLLGLSHILGRHTLLRGTYTFGYADGFLGDAYRITELNGQLVPEKRPGHRSKHTVYVSLTHYVEALQGSLEPSYRFYSDTFGVSGHTLALNWYQKLGPNLILRPSVRGYDQSSADFYGVRFAGDPQHYSSDYRISSFRSYAYGLKAIVRSHERVAWDIAYEHYKQQGQDGETIDGVYPSADIVTVGVNFRW